MVWQIWCCLQVALCDPYLSAPEAFAHKRAIQIHVYFTLFALHVCPDIISVEPINVDYLLTYVQKRSSKHWRRDNAVPSGVIWKHFFTEADSVVAE